MGGGCGGGHRHTTTKAGADPGGGGGAGGANAPPFRTEQALNAKVTARLAHVAIPTQRTSLYKSLLHVLQT